MVVYLTISKPFKQFGFGNLLVLSQMLLNIALVINTLLEGLFAGVFFAPDVIKFPKPFFEEIGRLPEDSIARCGFAIIGMGCLAIASLSAFTLVQPPKARSIAATKALAVFHAGVGVACYKYRNHMGSEPALVHGLMATLFAVCVTMQSSQEDFKKEK